MRAKNGIAFIGYNPKDFESKLMALDREYEKKAIEYSHKLDKLKNENSKLLEEINRLESEIAEYRSAKTELEKNLARKYAEFCKDLYDAENRLNEMVDYKTEVINTLEYKSRELKRQSEGLLDNIDNKLHKG